MSENEVRAPATMIILPCPTCGRAVTVLGRVRRVLCSCGQILMEIGRDNPSLAEKSVAKAG
jgi:hypothetical protein